MGVRELQAVQISIHALCEEGDVLPFLHDRTVRISIHALCEEGDPRWFSEGDGCESISIHALCEEGDGIFGEGTENALLFLSTPSARRATPRSIMRLQVRYNFYPRPLRGGRQAPSLFTGDGNNISIHALCEEGDVAFAVTVMVVPDFYPRPLRGGRQVMCFKQIVS